MKINRFVAMTAIALLVVGAMGAVSMKVFAQPATQTQNCDEQTNDAAEVKDASDTDNVEQECGDQNAPDGQESANEAESTDSVESAPTGTPAITAEAAQKTAEAYLNAGTATKVELDDENGKLVYSVEIGGTDVKVDAMTGSVLGTEPTED